MSKFIIDLTPAGPGYITTGFIRFTVLIYLDKCGSHFQGAIFTAMGMGTLDVLRNSVAFLIADPKIGRCRI